MPASGDRTALSAKVLTTCVVIILLVLVQGRDHDYPASQPRRQARQVEAGANGEEGWSYPFMALRDPVKHLIRIYGQYSVQVIGNDTNRGEATQFAGCVMKGNGREEIVPNVEEIIPLMQWDDNFTTTFRHTANYIIECDDPGSWATHTVVRIQNGDNLGRDLEIIDMPGERLGKLAVCSQPLQTDREWLRDWVDHQFQIGANEVFMHVPKGYQIDELFGSKRTERLNFNLQLAERSPGVTGKQPLKKFARSNTVWVDYWPGPTAEYYGEQFVFSACHYRNRYAYDYSIQFDIDEFWVPTNKSEEKLLPDFLDKHMEEKTAEFIFIQKQFPLDCPTRSSGAYADRFTLNHHSYEQAKPAVRPHAVERMHVHNMLDSSKEYKAKFGDKIISQTIGTDIAFLKHIRPMTYLDEENKLVYFNCHFGRESDPEGGYLAVDD